MATGSYTLNITIPITNAADPNNVSRGIVASLLEQAAQALGSPPSSGNLTYPPGPAPQIVGNWSLTPPT